MEEYSEKNLEMIEHYSSGLQYQRNRTEFEAHCLWWMANLLEENEVVRMIKTFDRCRRPVVHGFTRL
jgi:hypothetical protein